MRRLILAAAVLALLATDAAAQDGVPVDPDSPAGTEYQLPLERARSEAGAGAATEAPGSRGGDAAGGESSPALFGEGIEREDTGSRRAGAEGGKPGAGGSGKGTAEEVPQRSREVQAAAAGDSSSGLLVAAVVAGVLVLGLGAGLALRRGLGRQ